MTLKAVDVYVLWHTTAHRRPVSRWQRVARFYADTFAQATDRAEKAFRSLWEWTTDDGRMRIEKVK